MDANTELPATNGCDGRRSTDGRDAFEETLQRTRLSSKYAVTTVVEPPPFLTQTTN